MSYNNINGGYNSLIYAGATDAHVEGSCVVVADSSLFQFFLLQITLVADFTTRSVPTQMEPRPTAVRTYWSLVSPCGSRLADGILSGGYSSIEATNMNADASYSTSAEAVVALV